MKCERCSDAEPDEDCYDCFILGLAAMGQKKRYERFQDLMRNRSAEYADQVMIDVGRVMRRRVSA